MMPNVSYGPMLNPTMTRGASLGSGIRSLLGLGNARNFAGGVSRGINWSSLLNNTSKTLSVVREAIPIVKEVGPMMNNMKSMLKVASVFKDATDVNNEHKTNNNIKFKSLINTYKGFRLKNKLPCHGQNTHSNGKTAKKKCVN